MTQVSAGTTVVRGIAWMALGGLVLAIMNGLMRLMTQQMDPLQAQFLRYFFGFFALMPIIFRGPVKRLWPKNLSGQCWRGLAQTLALALFFLALPHMPLADMTAIMFTTPFFVLMGAAVFLGEQVSATRWLGAFAGFAGVGIVLWPHLTLSDGAGIWSLVMLGAAPLFATAFLLTKALTRDESSDTLVTWQNIVVTVLTLPVALYFWVTPDQTQWLILALCGALGTAAHWCFTRAFYLADISAVQPVRFLDLIWSSLLGLAIFGNEPSKTALLGGMVIVAASVWLARVESKRANRAAAQA
ncbi:MAG: DMT family transporter [Burkholderiaceae bacterium]